MKFLHLFNKSSSAYDAFAKIQGYEDIKDIVLRALESDENYNLLFVGPPSSSKTLFLQGILEKKSLDQHQLIITLLIESYTLIVLACCLICVIISLPKYLITPIYI